MWNVNGVDIDVHYNNDSRSSLSIVILHERVFATR